jgi:Haem-NO-binding
VTPESLLLHYYSSRPGLWPIVKGVLSGMAVQFFGLEGLNLELLHSRHAGDCDHEVRPVACILVGTTTPHVPLAS